VLFDRSWYNRAGVERVMGFCTDEQYEEFFRTVPEFERMLVRSGIQLIKYWFSISDEEQHLRFLGRIHDPLKQWKLSPMDLESRRRWEEYTKAKEIMLERSHIAEAPWWVVQAVDKKKARLNCISHLLGQMPYEETEPPADRAAGASAARGLRAPAVPARDQVPGCTEATRQESVSRVCHGRVSIASLVGALTMKRHDHQPPRCRAARHAPSAPPAPALDKKPADDGAVLRPCSRGPALHGLSLVSDVSEAGAPHDLVPFILLGVALLIALGFEFVNGFHDTPTRSRP
jgi:hypothetical protein